MNKNINILKRRLGGHSGLKIDLRDQGKMRERGE